MVPATKVAGTGAYRDSSPGSGNHKNHKDQRRKTGADSAPPAQGSTLCRLSCGFYPPTLP